MSPLSQDKQCGSLPMIESFRKIDLRRLDVDMLSTVAMSSDASGPTQRLRCEFAMPNCHHTALFKDSYLRTNRINHTKIMRCFPHCCPEHLRRSFCGSSLHVKLQWESGLRPTKRDATLVIYGRFRPEYTKRMPIGSVISAEIIESSLQSKDPSKGEWIECKLAKSARSNGWMYEINPSGRWYYPWNGAATIAMRITEHVFEALVFRRTGDKQLELVADVVSTQFRLASYRRGTKDASRRASLPKNLTNRTAATRTASPTDVTDINSLAALAEHSPRTVDQSDLPGHRRRAHKQPLQTIQLPANIPSIHRTSGPLGYDHKDTAPPKSGSASTSCSPHDELMRWLHELPTIGRHLKDKDITPADSPTDGVPAMFITASSPTLSSISPTRSSLRSCAVNSSAFPFRQQFPLESTSTDDLPGDRRRTHDQAFPTTSFPAPSSIINPPPPATKRTLPSHSSARTTLAMLTHWLHELPASSAGSRSMLAWQEMVQSACEAQVSASHEPTSARGGFVPLLSVLDREMTTQSTTRLSTSFSAAMTSHAGAAGSPLDTIDAAVRVLLHEWLAVDSTRASSAWMARLVRDGLAPRREELAAAHDEWLSGATARAQQYVHANTRASWSQLMATTARLVEQSQPMNELDATSEFGFRSFVAKYRERLQVDGRQHRSRKRQRLSANNVSTATLAATPRGISNFAPVWTSRMEDVSIDMGGMNQHSLSLLTVVQFWKHLSCLRLDFSPTTTGPTSPPAQLSVASVFNSLVSDGCFTKLTLDGQYRWFNCLPSGEPTVGTTLMGYVVGDYVGRATSAGTIHITTYMWPATNSGETTATAFAWHWTLDARSLSRDEGASSTVVSVVVESASVRGSPHAMETMSMTEKLRCVGRWQHAGQTHIQYCSWETR